MARIKIEDLPILEDLSAKEIKGIFGGLNLVSDDSDAAIMVYGWDYVAKEKVEGDAEK